MAVLEVRRHTMRSKPGAHLSQSGILLANRVGEETGPFNLVVSSEIPRAIETAIAMGYATDYQFTELGVLPENIYSSINWPSSLSTISNIAEADERCRIYSEQQAKIWYDVLNRVTDQQMALIITHGGIIELGAIGFAPHLDHAAWEKALGYCEGFRFTRHNDEITCKILRVPTEFYSVVN